MSRLILWLLCSCVLSASASGQANAPRELTDAEAAQIGAAINNVKSLPAHRLERRLPKVALADWLEAQAGPDAKTNWAYRSDPTAGSPGWQGPPDAVEADIALNDRQSIVVQVAVTHCDRQIVGCQRRVPSVFRIYVITGKNEITGKFEGAELDHLRDLPGFLQRLRESSEADR